MKRFLSFLVLPLLGLAPAGAQTLEEAIRRMLAHEPELLAAHADTHSAAEDILVARGELLPQVSLTGNSGSMNRTRTLDGLVQGAGQTLFTRQMGVSLRQLLFDGGVAMNQTRSMAHAHAMQQYLEKGMIEARVVDLAEVYLEVLRGGLQITEAKANIEIHEHIREQVHERSGVGGTRADTLLVDSRLTTAREVLVTHQLIRQRAIDRFVRLVGEVPDSLLHPRVPNLPASPDQIDLSRNWNFLSAEAALQATEDKRKALERSGLPKLFFDTGVTQGQDVLGVEGTDDEVRALIVLQWDLVRGGSRAATESREGWQVIRHHELLRAADLERTYRLNLLWRERQGDQFTLDSLRLQVDFLRQVAEDYESQFLLNKRDLLDILEIRGRHFDARTRLINSEYSLAAGTYRILGLQGRLVEFLLGEGAWDGLSLPDRESHSTEITAIHPHHPDGMADDPSHPAPSPAEPTANAAPKRGFFDRVLRHDHSDGPPREPRRGTFTRTGSPVSTPSARTAP